MTTTYLIADSYFDGQTHQNAGPYTVRIEEGVIERIVPEDITRTQPTEAVDARVVRAPFAMPGLCEGHCHLFLNGAELDFGVRKAYLKASREDMIARARLSLEENRRAGVTLIRDAGDIHGINLFMREELSHSQNTGVTLRCPGRAMRKAKRYGSFMALETTDEPGHIDRVVDELAQEADDLKILLTGIIDFENGTMKGGVQFDLAQARQIVAAARRHDLMTYAHCSGPEGLSILTEAGINSVEHGFFMEKRFLEVMAEKQIAWVPTFSPVYFQYERPELAGWNQTTVDKLWEILDNHFKHLVMAEQMGVPIVAGSDAGSYGVPHGSGLIDELLFHHRAGLCVDAVLASGSSTPRRLWGCDSADIKPGHQADIVTLEGSPYEQIRYLKSARQTLVAGSVCDLTATPVAMG